VSTRTSIAIAAAFTIILTCLSGATASAAPRPGSPDCTVVFSPISLGQGMEAFCDNAPGTYQVVAQCSDDLEYWTVPGTLTTAGDAPSVAECHGLLLFPAHVVSYFVVQ
jgi:hypothetical protein